jgi:hypothetical protein
MPNRTRRLKARSISHRPCSKARAKYRHGCKCLRRSPSHKSRRRVLIALGRQSRALTSPHSLFLWRRLFDSDESVFRGPAVAHPSKCSSHHNFAQNLLEESDWKSGMARNRDAMVARSLCNQNHVAADLVDLRVSPVLAEVPDHSVPAHIPRKPHAAKRTSSRTMCNRTIDGFGWSK